MNKEECTNREECTKEECNKRHSIQFKRLVSPIFLDVVKYLNIDIRPKGSKSDLILYDGICKIEKYHSIDPSIYLTKIPGLNEICKKSFVFKRVISFCEKSGQKLFFPKTYIHPEKIDPKFFEEVREDTTLIFKPDSGYGGKGIILCRGPKQIEKVYKENFVQNGVFQQYVDPKLSNKHKFDLRIFLLIAKLEPLTLFIYKEGSARFCLHEYDSTNNKDFFDLYSHLTSVSINSKGKEADKFTFIKKYSEAIKNITDKEEQRKKIWDGIKELAKNAILALKDDLLDKAEKACNQNDFEYKNGSDENSPIDFKERFFHMLGIDVLIDSQLNPLLLEINDNPGIRSFSNIDTDIKENLVKDEIELIYKYIKKEEEEIKVGGWEMILGKLIKNSNCDDTCLIDNQANMIP